MTKSNKYSYPTLHITLFLSHTHTHIHTHTHTPCLPQTKVQIGKTGGKIEPKCLKVAWSGLDLEHTHTRANA